MSAPPREQRRRIPLQEIDGARSGEVAGLDLFHEARATLGQHFDTLGVTPHQAREAFAVQRRVRCQHPDHAAARRGGGRLDRGLHPNEGHARKGLAKQIHGVGCGRVARNDDRARVPLLHEKSRDRHRAITNQLWWLGAIGHVRRVGNIHDVLVRQEGAQLAQHGQPANAGVEHAQIGGQRDQT